MSSFDPLNHIVNSLDQLRMQKPIVLSLTNYVAMNLNANALLAVGASPIMSHSRVELPETVKLANSVVINIGTLDSYRLQQMQVAISQANLNKKTVILDPVGCGASKLRLEQSRKFAVAINDLIIRANASEVMALAGADSRHKGVDSLESSCSAIGAAKKIISEYGAKEVIISGEIDYLVYSDQIIQLKNGSDMMPYVTAMGCTHSALTAAFSAIDHKYAGLSASAVLAISGEIAAKNSQGPASLQIHLIDQLYQINDPIIRQFLNVSFLDE